ncbi:MAG: DUF4091 domain-containing protein [Chloroflexi bacterium]|nr:DUF4091 domain-containing protein [Chloroflexota bacterium]
MSIQYIFTSMIILVALSACGVPAQTEPVSDREAVVTPIYVASPIAPVTGHLAPIATSNIARIWANTGEDKVTQDELRATSNPNAVLNSVWDGTGISLFGARNEIVAFNLVLETPNAEATAVDVALTSLSGLEGASITTREATDDDLFNYIGRNIELFYVRYLEIKGVSTDLFYAGYDYDERHIPERCRRPHDTDGEGRGGWTDRPCHNKLYPEIAVPLELNSPFTISAGTNQSIWGDIYIPKSVPAGHYNGTISIMEDGIVTWEVPISLQVRNFTLPDLPSARTMLYFSQENINDRYLGEVEPEPGSPVYAQAQQITDRHFQLAHRHKISLIGNPEGYTPIEEMDQAWLPRLTGELFTPERGYEGVGVGVGNNVYAIAEYGSWPWQEGGRAEMWANSDAWVTWFEEQAFIAPTEYFLYLIDESDDYEQIERWAGWINDNPGPGQRLMSFATIDLPIAASNTPSLDIPASWVQFALPEAWQDAAANYAANPNKRFYMYNGNRPASGSFGIEDEGVALRELAWGQYKLGIDRWFYWESTYYNNFQGDMGQTNAFQLAHTYGSLDEIDDVFGETGWNYVNGDGVLFYPGTDKRFPADSYGVMAPFASLRLKFWRRGVQDVDYLTLAAAIDPERTAQIVQAIIPSVVWEIGVTEPEDPSYVLTDISWPTDPNLWEMARQELVDIIEHGEPGSSEVPFVDVTTGVSAEKNFADGWSPPMAAAEWMITKHLMQNLYLDKLFDEMRWIESVFGVFLAPPNLRTRSPKILTRL